MSDDVFDVIVVGGGVAGCSMAYMLAQEDLSVVLIERGNSCGAKSVTGGRLYTNGLERLIPHFLEEAPLERRITREVFTMLTEDSAVGTEYVAPTVLSPTGAGSYSVRSGPLCRWLADKAAQAGAEIVTGVTVTDLIVEDGTVLGVKSGDESLRAHVTVLAEGANAKLSQTIGFRPRFKPWELGMGIKETFELPASVIEDRFHCRPGEGTANFFVGSPTDGFVGSGFIITNKESISVGVTATLYRMMDGYRSVPAMLEALKNHPAVAPLLAGGKLVEHAGSLIPQGGYHAIPKILDDGIVIIGDGAGYCLNLGYTIRGLDMAIESALCAKRGIVLAIEREDYSQKYLLAYRGDIMESPIERDMKPAGKFPRFMDENSDMFERWPKAMSDIMENLYVFDRVGGKNLKMKVELPLDDHFGRPGRNGKPSKGGKAKFKKQLNKLMKSQ